jgi:putative transposase
LAVKVTGAQRSDQQGGKMMLSSLKEKFPKMQLLWGDSHYGGTMITWLKIHLGWTMQTVRALTVPKRGVLVPEGTDVDWEQLFPSGFRLLPRRWVVERSFSWIVRWRRLARDHEGLPETSEAFIKISASRRMLTKLVATA